ncbi:MAG: glycoside hydrolase family 26 protein, partial [Bacteroidales bacterium]|nr:glycoside hydrolase family 26 protein [Bacteroidales bacterium]
MKRTFSIFGLATVVCMMAVACTKVVIPGRDTTDYDALDPSSKSLSLADANATVETKALYSNLWAIQSKGFMFGHHDDLTYGRYWYGDEGGSDTKAVCGDYPAVYSMDFAEMIDDRAASNKEATTLKLRCIKEAYDRGMVVIGCIHINNPLTGGDSWDNSSSKVASEIMKTGSATNKIFLTWLDRLADIALSLKGSDGKAIPIIFRPFHEHTQTWSWWGSSCTTEQEFKELWQFTIKYLRDTKGVHNFIYAISPQMDSSKKESDFYFRWPGDEWVDFIGMDCYQGINNLVFTNNLKAISAVSKAKMKPCGVTETGVEGFSTKDYWTNNILAPMTGRNVALLVTWRNKYVGVNESDKHFFSVYPGHASAPDFVKMYSSPISFFCSDLP